MAEVKEDSVCVLKGLGANKQGRKHSRASFLLSYTWVRSPSGVQDHILRSAFWKVGKVLPSLGAASAGSTPSLEPSNWWDFSSWLLCGGILFRGTFLLTSIQGGQPVSLVAGET